MKVELVLCLVIVFAHVLSLGAAKISGVVVSASEEDVAVSLAADVAFLSSHIITHKHSFSVVLSGGSLIYTLRKLTEHPYNTTVDWSKWIVFWVDERVVPLNDSFSNYKLALDGFFSKVPIPQSNIYPINYMESPAAVAGDYEGRLRKLVAEKIIPLSVTGFPKFDLMLLGIGFDGHVASLFPNRPQRYEKKRWVTFITDSPKPPPERITLTFPVINSASNTAIVVTGAGAADAVAAALGDVVSQQRITLTFHVVVSPPLPCAEVKADVLTWYLDKEAASKLH